VVGDLPDTLVGEHLVLVRVLDGAGIIRPARREGGIATSRTPRTPRSQLDGNSQSPWMKTTG
jgi:hypothetical protein